VQRTPKKAPDYDLNGQLIPEGPTEPVYGPDNPPPVPPPPAPATRRPCRKCGHVYTLAVLKPFLIPITSEIYKLMLIVFKDEKWLKTMLHKQKTDPETYEIEGKKKKQAFRLNQYEIFCELCWHLVHRDIEYRQL
jgi:hypothetical protein